MKGTRFADVAAIQEHVTAVLRSIPKEAFVNGFQKLQKQNALHKNTQQTVTEVSLRTTGLNGQHVKPAAHFGLASS
jgi:hypothetical protein